MGVEETTRWTRNVAGTLLDLMGMQGEVVMDRYIEHETPDRPEHHFELIQLQDAGPWKTYVAALNVPRGAHVKMPGGIWKAEPYMELNFNLFIIPNPENEPLNNPDVLRALEEENAERKVRMQKGGLLVRYDVMNRVRPGSDLTRIARSYVNICDALE